MERISHQDTYSRTKHILHLYLNRRLNYRIDQHHHTFHNFECRHPQRQCKVMPDKFLLPQVQCIVRMFPLIPECILFCTYQNECIQGNLCMIHGSFCRNQVCIGARARPVQCTYDIERMSPSGDLILCMLAHCPDSSNHSTYWFRCPWFRSLQSTIQERICSRIFDIEAPL